MPQNRVSPLRKFNFQGNRPASSVAGITNVAASKAQVPSASSSGRVQQASTYIKRTNTGHYNPTEPAWSNKSKTKSKLQLNEAAVNIGTSDIASVGFGISKATDAAAISGISVMNSGVAAVVEGNHSNSSVVSSSN